MKQLTIRDMDEKQLQTVFEYNEGLQNEVIEDAIDGEMNWISEHLDVLKNGLQDWSVGRYDRCYIVPRSAEPFIDALNELETGFGVLDASGRLLLEEAVEVVEKYRSEELYSEAYYTLDRQMDRLADRLATMVAMSFEKALNYHTFATCKEYFVDFYAHNRLDGDEYIEIRFDDSTDWKLKKTIVKTF